VAALSTYSGAAIQLTWSGSDNPGGSGIASYSVYVSNNGGPFVPFLTDTTQTSATFQGQNGHVYGFYSVATDAIGNQEAAPSQAEAVTQVDAVPPTSQVAALPALSSITFQLTWSGNNPGPAPIVSYDIYVSDNGGPFTAFARGTTQTSITFQGQPGHTYGFYSVATDAAGNVQATPAAAQATTSVPLHVYVTGADAGGGPEVKVFSADTGQLLLDFFAFSPSFTGGVRVAVGYLQGNGTPDIICAPGPGGGPNISVFNGLTGQRLAGPLGSFFAFDPHFSGGLYVAAGDVYGTGYDDIIVGADSGGGPNVTVFDGQSGNRVSSFFAYNPFFTGGVRVAAGDLNGDGHDQIITGAGPGGGPNVSIFDAAGNLLNGFFAYNPSFAPGIYVAAGDLNGAAQADIITGPGAGGGPQVSVFAEDGTPLGGYFAFDPSFTGGVRVAAATNADGTANVIAVQGPGGGPQVSIVSGPTLEQIDSFFAYNALFSGGLFVAGN
jgi:hypothetical protein